MPLDRLKAKIESLHEMNPMLGHRGCRLGITYPEIYDMQVRAIMEAACAVAGAGAGVLPEIMIPLVGTVEELSRLRERAEKVAADVLAAAAVKVEYQIGTMIEIPRAAVTADRVAEAADFFSFGTNDLTQMMFGYSRDDARACFSPSTSRRASWSRTRSRCWTGRASVRWWRWACSAVASPSRT